MNKFNDMVIDELKKTHGVSIDMRDSGINCEVVGSFNEIAHECGFVVLSVTELCEIIAGHVINSQMDSSIATAAFEYVQA